jgi:hypothetical protein
MWDAIGDACIFLLLAFFCIVVGYILLGGVLVAGIWFVVNSIVGQNLGP